MHVHAFKPHEHELRVRYDSFISLEQKELRMPPVLKKTVKKITSLKINNIRIQPLL
jgi:hypothetical protein